jgi:hypothetical protein
MNKKTSLVLAAGTVAGALGIGAAMQYRPGSNYTDLQKPIAIEVSEVQDVSSTPKPSVPFDRPITEELPTSVVSNPASVDTRPAQTLPESPAASGFECDVALQADPAAGAMVSLALTAPCHGSERVTVHHNGLMFTETVQPDGTLSVTVPALAEKALFIASFLDGSGAVAQTDVTSVPFYDRIVLQWRGDAGLQLHAREFDAAYFSDGHIWHGAQANAERAATGKGGFLTRLGHFTAPDALLADVYTFPTATTETSGTIALTVEAEILATNCETQIDAQTLEMTDGGSLHARDLTIDVPSCDTIGDFLMLKNVVKDLTIAAN